MFVFIIHSIYELQELKNSLILILKKKLFFTKKQKKFNK